MASIFAILESNSEPISAHSTESIRKEIGRLHHDPKRNDLENQTATLREFLRHVLHCDYGLYLSPWTFEVRKEYYVHQNHVAMHYLKIAVELKGLEEHRHQLECTSLEGCASCSSLRRSLDRKLYQPAAAIGIPSAIVCTIIQRFAKYTDRKYKYEGCMAGVLLQGWSGFVRKIQEDQEVVIPAVIPFTESRLRKRLQRKAMIFLESYRRYQDVPDWLRDFLRTHALACDGELSYNGGLHRLPTNPTIGSMSWWRWRHGYPFWKPQVPVEGRHVFVEESFKNEK